MKGKLLLGLSFAMALSASVPVFAAQVNCVTGGCSMNDNGAWMCFMDNDGDGICGNHYFVDGNGDGICDYHFYYDVNADGICDYFIDADQNGICDHCHDHGRPVQVQPQTQTQTQTYSAPRATTTVRSGHHGGGHHGGGHH